MGLYRDDGLIVLRNSTKRTADIKHKEVIKIFKSIGFDIEIDINLSTVDFLDVTLDLTSNTFRPYKKPNDQLLYVHTSSNHPVNILKQLPISINERLSKNSSNRKVFDYAKPEYERALRNSGYEKPGLSFTRKTSTKLGRQRKRNIIWFNPPYSKNVSTKCSIVTTLRSAIVALKTSHRSSPHTTRRYPPKRKTASKPAIAGTKQTAHWMVNAEPHQLSTNVKLQRRITLKKFTLA